MKQSSSTPLVYLIIIAVAFLLTVKGLAKNAGPNNLEELKGEISKIIVQYNIPAFGIALIKDRQPIWVGSLGKANLENDIDADENSLYRIASTSKMFVALSVLKLVEQGKLNLNDKLIDITPEIEFTNKWQQSNPILLVNLLEHTTGWDEQHYPEFAHNDPTPATLKQGLDFHPHSRTSRWPPSTRFSYTNSGPAVAAYIIEKISGMNFENYVQQNFFNPIGMSTASFYQPASNSVTLYDSSNKPLNYSHMIMRPSGSINASPRDMARFLQFYLNRGLGISKQVLSKKSLARMEQVKSTSSAKAGQIAGYGLNNYSSFHKQWIYREHNGGFEGTMTEFAYLPEANLGHAFMINKKHPLAFQKISTLIRNYETRDLKSKDILNKVKITDIHREIQGLYYSINPRLQKLAFLFNFRGIKKFQFKKNILIQSGIFGGQKRYYYPVSPTLYKSKDNGVISLSLVDDPIAGRVIHDSSKSAGSANNVVLKPIATWLGYTQSVIEIMWLLVLLSSVFYFLIWFARKLLGKIPTGATIYVRVWPLLASLSMISTVILLIIASSDYYYFLSQKTVVSIGVMLTTLSYALFSIIAVYTVYNVRNSTMNRVNYWYCVFSSTIHIIMLVYLYKYGVIGIRFWA